MDSNINEFAASSHTSRNTKNICNLQTTEQDQARKLLNAYLKRLLVDELKKRWVGMYVNKLAHIGSLTTNRVEGAHATLKSILRNASGNLSTAFKSIDDWYLKMEETAKLQLDRSRFLESTKLHWILSHLRGVISAFAYEKLKVEITQAWQFDIDDKCDCITRYVYLLPCKHTNWLVQRGVYRQDDVNTLENITIESLGYITDKSSNPGVGSLPFKSLFDLPFKSLFDKYTHSS